MPDAMSHHEIELLLGAYALDAVDADEANAVELHLRECPRCEAEVAEFRETAALLAHGGITAPAGVWDGIVARLEDRPPPLASITGRQARRPRRWPTIASAAAAVVLVAASVAWVVGRQSPGPSRPTGLDSAIIAAYADPSSHATRLVSTDGSHYADVVIRGDGTGYLVRHNLPSLGGDRTYQLWANVGSATVSLGVLGGAPHSLAFAAAAKTRIVALAITDEQAGGVVSTRRSPVVAGSVPI
jgi:anti-sigma-K factor RskA